MAKVVEKTAQDVVIQETRKHKEMLAASMDFDLNRILQDARQKQKLGGKKVLPAPASKRM